MVLEDVGKERDKVAGWRWFCMAGCAQAVHTFSTPKESMCGFACKASLLRCSADVGIVITSSLFPLCICL